MWKLTPYEIPYLISLGRHFRSPDTEHTSYSTKHWTHNTYVCIHLVRRSQLRFLSPCYVVVLSFKYAASCLYSIASKIGLWQLFVSWFNWMLLFTDSLSFLCMIFFLTFDAYSHIHTIHVIYMANSTAKLLLKNAKRQSCHISSAHRVTVEQHVNICASLVSAIGKLYIHWSDDKYCMLYTWKIL